MTYMENSISRLTPKEQTQFLALFNKFVGDEYTVPYDKLFEQTLTMDFKESKKKD